MKTYLLAKIKGRGHICKHLLTSNLLLFSIPNNGDLVKFDPRTLLDEAEWFYIDKFSTTDFYPANLGGKFDSTQYNSMDAGDLGSIEYLLAFHNKKWIIQKINPKQIIEKRLISLKTFKISEPEPLIAINEYPDAIYFKDDDRLVFRNLSAITSIFKGIESIYRIATSAEVEKFIALPCVAMDPAFDKESIKTANRKRIALVLDGFAKLPPDEKDMISTYIAKYCPALYNKKAKTFNISNEEDLKRLLFGMDQRFYTTLVGNEDRIANSVTKLS